jgi:hypothetical protein
VRTACSSTNTATSLRSFGFRYVRAEVQGSRASSPVPTAAPGGRTEVHGITKTIGPNGSLQVIASAAASDPLHFPTDMAFGNGHGDRKQALIANFDLPAGELNAGLVSIDVGIPGDASVTAPTSSRLRSNRLARTLAVPEFVITCILPAREWRADVCVRSDRARPDGCRGPKTQAADQRV